MARLHKGWSAIPHSNTENVYYTRCPIKCKMCKESSPEKDIVTHILFLSHVRGVQDVFS